MEQLFSFSVALEKVKKGCKIQRDGWNGKGMFVFYQKAYPEGIPLNREFAEASGVLEETVCAFLPYLMMWSADFAFVPWVASQTDILAEDWRILS